MIKILKIPIIFHSARKYASIASITPASAARSSMTLPTTVKLNTGAFMPVLGLGTWRSEPGQVEYAVEYALRYGYRHIDTASDYENEEQVGEGIHASEVPRQDIFLTTKLRNLDHVDVDKDGKFKLEDNGLNKVEQAFEISLSNLYTPYIDLWLMHWPAPMKLEDDPDFGEVEIADKAKDWLDTWRAIEALYKKEQAKGPNATRLKAIGVSNVSISYFERIFNRTGEEIVVPAVNQIELHPACPQTELREYCESKGVVITAYSPLGSDAPRLRGHPIVVDLAQKKGVSPATILLSLQANIPNTTVLAKSVTKERIESNLTLIELSKEEIETLLSIPDRFRVCGPEWTGWEDLGFPDCK